MPYFLKSGNRFRVSAKESLDLHERLPTATYTIGQTPDGEFFLETIDSFEIQGKLYGDTTRNASRILGTFLDRSASTGVLLSGEKGSGKTLLAKLISIQAAQQDIPTIVINKSWSGESFNSFLQMIEQPTILLFDEYEKVYERRNDQDNMLTLLDGVYPSKKLFLLTCNDKWKVSTNMRNRPGRIYYMLDFNGLGQDFVREYCMDNLINKNHLETVCAISVLFTAFNFDMLKGMVEEMNRYDESPSQVLKFLNIRPEFNSTSRYEVQLRVKGVDLDHEKHHCTRTWQGNPLLMEISIPFAMPNSCGKTEKFTARDLQQMDGVSRTYVFVNKEGSRLVLTPANVSFSFDYDKLGSSDVPIGEALSSNNNVPPSTSGSNILEMMDNCGDY